MLKIPHESNVSIDRCVVLSLQDGDGWLPESILKQLIRLLWRGSLIHFYLNYFALNQRILVSSNKILKSQNYAVRICEYHFPSSFQGPRNSHKII